MSLKRYFPFLVLVVIVLLINNVGAEVVTGVTIDSFYSENVGLDRMAGYVVDGSGLDAGGPGTHTSYTAGTMWMNSDATATSQAGVDAQWFIFDLGGLYDLESTHIWNYNEVCAWAPDYPNDNYYPFWTQRRGVYEMEVLVSADKITWTSLGLKYLTAASGLDTDLGETVALNASGVRYVKFDINSNQCSSGVWDPPLPVPNPDTDYYVGLSEVQFESQIPTTAYEPNPVDGATKLPLDIVLSWSPGNDANMHDIYVGTNLDDVSNATTSSTGIYKGRQYAFIYYPYDLDYNTTYYWRIDEVKLVNPDSPRKGKVWSFVTNDNIADYEVLGVTIQDVSSELEDGARKAEYIVDGSGLDFVAPGTHRNFPWGTMWLSRTGEVISDQYLIFDLNGTYELTGVRIWNYNENALGDYTSRGVNEMEILVSADNSTYASLGIFNLSQASGIEDVDFSEKIPVTVNGVRYVKFDINSNLGDSSYVGLSEVRFIATVPCATIPTPKDGAKDVSVNVKFGWSPGKYANAHEMYLGKNFTEVQTATNPAVLPGRGRDFTNSFSPGILDLDTTYYWRVDECNDALPPYLWEGDIWSFTTSDYVAVDDFDSYMETIWLWDKWQDGSNQSPMTGSQILLEKGHFAGDHWVRLDL